ncbi:hypothetical protein GQX73_g1408 [Xylaria multiplex]|uniref:Myb-like domain-containing protein n=1 Tax=Xylaria multiplex TaxID=323545 RepID=A0A7C8N383_9PEZI|nr:hypothetical protein GQX73_g1408 [Xylaria multiplex]
MQQWQVGPVPEYLYGSAQHTDGIHTTHPYQPDMSRRNEFAGYATPGQNPATQHPQHGQQHHQQQPQHGQHQPHQPQHGHQSHGQHGAHTQHQQQQHQHTQHQSQSQHHQQHHATPVPPPINLSAPTTTPAQQSTPTQTPAQPAARGRKRPAPGHQQATQQSHQSAHPQPHTSTPTPTPATLATPATTASAAVPTTPATAPTPVPAPSVTQQTPVPAPTPGSDGADTPSQPPVKKSRTNTPWTPAEELRLKQMRDSGNSWAEIAKTFPTRTEGSVKKHWYKDMHYAEFAEDESQALLNAIKDYENNKWKTIGQKVGKPAKACEQYAKEHFPDLFATQKAR